MQEARGDDLRDWVPDIHIGNPDEVLSPGFEPNPAMTSVGMEDFNLSVSLIFR